MTNSPRTKGSVFARSKRRKKEEKGRGSSIILWRSEALHVALSQAPRLELTRLGDLHMQARLERLPQPEAGMLAF